jgi:hypothetical protein
MSYRPPRPEDRPIAQRPLAERVTVVVQSDQRAIRRWKNLSFFLLATGISTLVFWEKVKPVVDSVRSDVIAKWEKKSLKATKTWPKAVPVDAKPLPVSVSTTKTKNDTSPKTTPPTLVDLPALALKANEFPAYESWPTLIGLQSLPDVEVVQDSKSGSPYVYRSAHYEFRSDIPLGPDVVREFSKVFEATYMAVSRLPLDFRPHPEPTRKLFVAQLFRNKEKYMKAGGMAGSAGCYKRAESLILVPLDSLGIKVLPGGRTILERGGDSNGTLIHEITHQLMNQWLPRLPIWFTEGAAEYMVVPEYMHGRFNFGQIQNHLSFYFKQRIRGKEIGMLSPSELLMIDARMWSASLANESEGARQNYHSSLLLTFYFFHLDGEPGQTSPIESYLRAVEKGMPHLVACQKYLVRDRSPEKLDADVQTALNSLGLFVTLNSRGGKKWAAPEPVQSHTKS